MKAALLVFIVICSSAHADEWKPVDYWMLGAATTLLIADWGQTRDLTRRPAYAMRCDGCRYEHNPILGKHPSIGEVDKYFALAILGTAGISYALTPKWRRYFLGSVIVLEGFMVIHNHQIGLRAEF